MFHCSDITPEEDRHRWCPPNIKDEPEIKSLFERLRDDTLLSKCLHGKTQNVNESLNGIIWTRCPKRVYLGKKTLEMGISSAVLQFNIGRDGIFHVLEVAGLQLGTEQRKSNTTLVQRNKRRILRKSKSPVKRRRIELRAIRKNWDTKNNEEEEETYTPGGF